MVETKLLGSVVVVVVVATGGRTPKPIVCSAPTHTVVETELLDVEASQLLGVEGRTPKTIVCSAPTCALGRTVAIGHWEGTPSRVWIRVFGWGVVQRFPGGELQER